MRNHYFTPLRGNIIPYCKHLNLKWPYKSNAIFFFGYRIERLIRNIVLNFQIVD